MYKYYYFLNKLATCKTIAFTVEFLTMQFNPSNKAAIPKVKNGLDCRKIETVKLCKAVSASFYLLFIKMRKGVLLAYE